MTRLRLLSWLCLGLIVCVSGATSHLSVQNVQSIDPAVLNYVMGELGSWAGDQSEKGPECRNGASEALRGLDQVANWLWSDHVYIYDEESKEYIETHGVATLSDGEAEQEWIDGGRIDSEWPGGDEVTLSRSQLGNRVGNGIYHIPKSEILVFTVAHEALHLLPGGGPQHEMEAFSDLEACWGQY